LAARGFAGPGAARFFSLAEAALAGSANKALAERAIELRAALRLANYGKDALRNRGRGLAE
jgi:hypothetical protein